jgi:hypothetical protein
MLSLTIKSQYSKKPQFIAVWSIEGYKQERQAVAALDSSLT